MMKKTSDLTLKFENGNKIYAHKLILSNQSDQFSKLIEEGKENEILFDKDDNEKIVMKVIKFIYTGSYDYSNEEDTIPFLVYSNNYGIKSIKELKLPAKEVLDGIIDYVEKDLNGRKEEFEILTDHLDFKKLSVGALLKKSKKHKWLSSSTNYLNQIVIKKKPRFR